MNQQELIKFLRDSFLPEWKKCEATARQNPSYLKAIKQGLMESGASIFPLAGPASLGFLKSLKEQRQDKRMELIETMLGLNDKEKTGVAEKTGISPRILDEMKKFYIMTSENQRQEIVQAIEKLRVGLSQEHEIIRVKLEAIERALHTMKVGTFQRANKLADVSPTAAKVENYHERIRKSPNDPIAYVERGRAYSNTGQYDKALTDFNTAINIDRKISPAYFRRAGLFKIQGKITEALDDYTTCIRLDRKNYVALSTRGDLYADTGQYKQAIKDYSKAIGIDKTWWVAYLGRGIVYKRQKAYGRAIKDFSQAMEFEPNEFFLYGLRGDAYYLMAKYEKAVSDFTRAISLNPNDDFSYFQRGIIFGEKKLYNRAIQDLTSSLRLDPDYPVAYYRRAHIYQKKHEYEKAVIDYSRAVQILVSERNYSYADRTLRRMLKVTKSSDEQLILPHLQAVLTVIGEDPRMREKWSKKLVRCIERSKRHRV